ncbi:MAG: type II secretion system secretin GspD [Rhodanobacteraceae bacterium]
MQTPDGSILTADTILKPAVSLDDTGGSNTGISISPQALYDGEPPTPEIQTGTGKFFNQQPAQRSTGSGDADVVFNFENQPIQAVVKAILGDLLQENYTIAPNVGGNVTFSTSKPIRRSEALPVLEALLAANGASLVQQNGRYTVMLTKEAIPGRLTPNMAPVNAARGYELRIFPLRYVSASEMAKLLKPYAKPEAFVNIDPNRSLLVMAGTADELQNYQQTIETFDVDWLKGMSIGVFTLQHVEVGKLLPDLLKIFGTEGESPLAGMFRFMPIEQTNSIVVITPQPAYLKNAEEWLYRLDRGGAENATQLYVYNVKNLKAPDLADYLSQIFLGTSTGSSHRSSTSGAVAPGLRSTTLGSRGGDASGMSYKNSLRPQSDKEKAAPAAAGTNATTPATPGSGNRETDIRISAIEENNQLMIQATPIEWDRIESAIKKLDIIPLQVQIEARILEVTLTGNLNYGVQWYLAGLIGTAQGSAEANGNYRYNYPAVPGEENFTGNSHDRHRTSLGATGNVTPTGGGGFFYSFLNKNFEVAISALETSGQAKSLAAPSLVVANNQEAQINVGQQIPVVQTYYNGLNNIGTGTNAGNTSGTTGSVQYLSTGVTLDVKPRVNPGGLVYLDIQQEVSNPGPIPANSASGNPPINQRLIQTQVAVQSGETLLLGGLIRDNTNTSDSGIPLINRVPVLRHLFGTTTNSKDRTELIVLITPRVIRNSDEARQMTQEYTRQFESLQPMQSDMHPPSITPPPQAPPPPPPPAVTEPLLPQEEMPRDQ